MIDAANTNTKYRIVKNVSDISSLLKNPPATSKVPGNVITTHPAAA
jgi:hypothetical protein